MGLVKERQTHIELIEDHIRDTFGPHDDPDREVERCGEKIAGYLNNHVVMLVDVMDQFGEKLTSQDVQDRAKAVDILHYMFTYLKPDALKMEELTYLIDFLVDRLRDQHLVVPKVILCLQPVVKYKNLPHQTCSKIMNRIFEEVNIQTQIHRIRRAYFLAVQHLLKYKVHLDDIQQNSPNFVEHFLFTYAGEKDPRNLVILFNIIPTVLNNFRVQPLEEEVFESLACYFPIDFNPVTRANSVETITREDLAKGLHVCLSRTNLFAKFLIPLALEKLSSSLIDAKLDSLHLLSMCCDECYGPEELSPFLRDIWHALRREVFLEAKEEVEWACITFIRSAFKALSQNSSILKTSIDMIFSECKHHLSEPELRLSQPASRVLLAIIESNEAACSESFGLIVSLLHQQFLENSITSNRKAILSLEKKFVAALGAYPALWSLSPSALLPNWDEILGTWFTLLSHSDTEFVILALNLFLQLFDNKLSNDKLATQQNGDSSSFGLDRTYRNLLQEHLYTLIEKPDIPKDLASCAISVMDRFAFIYPEEVIPLLMNKLLNSLIASSERSSLNSNILKAISECSVVPDVGRVTIPRLLELSTSTETSSSEIMQILDCLANVVDKIYTHANVERNEPEGLISFICRSLNSVERLLKAGTLFAQNRNHEAYKTISLIVTTIMRAADSSTQQYLVDLNWNQIQKKIGKHPDRIPAVLAEALLAPLYPNVKIDKRMELIIFLLDKITSRSSEVATTLAALELQENKVGHEDQQYCEDPDAYVGLVAVLHNKLDGAEFEFILRRIEVILQKILFDDTKDEQESTVTESHGHASSNGRENMVAVLNLLILTTKSLAMKGSPDLDKWIDKLIALLGNGKYGSTIAEGFSKILSDSNSSLVPENHCVFKFLHRQRFFMISVPKLISAYRQCATSIPNETCKMNYIKALSCQLKFVPKSILYAQLENVIPLLVAGLSITGASGSVLKSDQLVVLSSLNAILELFTVQGTSSADESPKSSLIEYFRDLAPRLLELTCFQENMEIRIAALKCLQRCAKFPTHIIMSLKTKIVNDLCNCLDDPKRLVRKEAVLTRNIWILAGAPGGIS